ncbi:hypothetical protein I4F81_001791 [Pyropia yezoensis]|uniref:Uncharacterized protein n=1 Tax=Pyropia yezoensis TaxID=2788 RepID=A0ACC3BN79_PYRYE|nr:hypothetical protein I4F81_001791 [Neopyropia yezoensis]
MTPPYTILSLGADGVHLHGPADTAPRHTLALPAPPPGAPPPPFALTHDGARLYVFPPGGTTAYAVPPRGGAPLMRAAPPERPLVAAAASPCGSWLAAGAASGRAYVWDAPSGALLRAWDAHYRGVTALVWTDDGGGVVTAGGDGLVALWPTVGLVATRPLAGGHGGGGGGGDAAALPPPPLAPPTALATLSPHALPVSAMAVGSGGVSARLLTAAADGGARVTHLPSGAAVGSILLPSPASAVAWTADEAGAYVGCADGGVRAVAVDALHPAVPVAPSSALRAPTSAGAVTDLVVPPVGVGGCGGGGGGGGGGLVAAYADGSVRVWAPAAGAVLRLYSRHAAGRVRLALLPPAVGGHPPPAGTAAAAAAAAVGAAAARPPPPLARMVTAAEWAPQLGALDGGGVTATAAAATAAAEARAAAVWAAVDTAAAAIGVAGTPSGGAAGGEPPAVAAAAAATAAAAAAVEEVVALRAEVARLCRDKEQLAAAGRRLCGLLGQGAFPV